MTKSLAELDWISAVLPRGKKYIAPAYFSEHSAEWGADDWSLVVEPYRDVSQWKDVVIYFLASDAPHSWLHPGAMFELFEGPKLVARGTVVDKLE
jgi:hypothetical protein